MSFDRDWLEEQGSEDSNGRAVWALGHTVENAPDAELRAWAWRWYEDVLPHCAAADLAAHDRVHHARRRGGAARAARPQAVARDARRTAATCCSACSAARGGPTGRGSRRCSATTTRGSAGADRGGHGARRATTGSTPGSRRSNGSPTQQTAANGHFRPIGSESFGKPHKPLPFDQQPLEAQAAIEAARTAWTATGDRALVRACQGGVGLVLRRQRPRRGARRPRHRPLPRRGHPARRERELRGRIDSRLSTRPLFHASARTARSSANSVERRTLGVEGVWHSRQSAAYPRRAPARRSFAGRAAAVPPRLAGEERARRPRAEAGPRCRRAERGAVEAEYERVRGDFVERHWQTEKMFDDRFDEVEETPTSTAASSRARASG